MIEKVLKIANNFFGTNVSQDMKIGDIENWDSLGHINFFMALEEEFKIKFSPDEVIENDSIEKIIKLINTKQNHE